MRSILKIETAALVALLVLTSILCLGTMPAVCVEKTITDMEGRTVPIIEPPERVVTGGFIMPACIMAALGVGDKIVASGQKYNDVSTVTIVVPGIEALPSLGDGPNINVEATVALNPDIVILENDGAGQRYYSEAYKKLINQLSLFNESFSVVVINNPACYDNPSPDTVYEEIAILGDLFDKQKRASEIIDLLKDEVALVTDRTKDIKPEERASVLFMALTLKAGENSSKTQGKLALILPDYDCGTLYPEITKIKNAFAEKTRLTMSAERLLTYDPDVIIGSGTKGLLYNDTYNVLHGMRAIKEKKVYSIGRLEGGHNLAGLEFAIEILIEAKAAYPGRFKDINVGEQLTKHYKALYGLDDAQVKTLKEAMSLDWMDNEGF